MINPIVFVTHLTRAVDLFRDPAKKEEQKREFRTLVGMLKDDSATVRAKGGRLEVNGQPVESPAFQTLVQRMELHSVTEMTVPKAAPVGDVFELLRALADQPGSTDDVAARLHASGAYRVSVVLQNLSLPPEAAPTQAAVADPQPTPSRPDTMGTAGVLRGDPMSDIQSMRIAGVDGVQQVAQTPDTSGDSLPQIGAADPESFQESETVEAPPAPAPTRAAPPPVQPPPPPP